MALILAIGWGMSHRQGLVLEAELEATEAQLTRSEAPRGSSRISSDRGQYLRRAPWSTEWTG